MKILLKLIIFLCLFNLNLFAESFIFSGKVIDSNTNEPIKNASISISNLPKIYFSNSEGIFNIPLEKNTLATLTIRLIGYETLIKEINSNQDSEFLEFKLKPDPVSMGSGITVTSSRANVYRSNIETAVPIDLITSSEIEQAGHKETTQILRALVPSFNSGRQTFSDATDHIDPATLRSLGPDQVLVLINGKRRHTTSLVNITPIVGKGSVGTDLNSIPVSAIDRIEILRDGASAQYGSDAIAGVINIILKESSHNANIALTAGQTNQNDGQHVTIGSNFGFNLADKGFFNLTFEGRRREATNRANEYQGLIYRTDGQDGLSFEDNFSLDNQIIADRGLSRSDFNLIIGNSAQTNASLFLNSELNLSQNSEFYAFGGINYRESKSAGFYRFPFDSRNNLEIYPNGYLPFLSPKVIDNSLAFGFKTIKNDWLIDISNTFGRNRIDYFVENSLNRAWGNDSPTNFYSGANEFSQNTINIDLSRDYGKLLNLQSFIVSSGVEFRYENYQIIAGEESSWSTLPSFKDSSYQPGSQVFPGFRPENSIDATRHSFATYLEIQTDITDKLLVSTAGRFENFSDFGTTVNGEFAVRYKFDELFLLRSAISSGFRAPSLHQQYFSNVSTFFFDAGDGTLFPFDVATVSNNSKTTKALGIGQLNEETALNFSAGFTSRLSENTTLTVDAYQIDINDRIVLSGYFIPAFDPSLAELLSGINEADAAQFFSNAIDTRTQGIDIILAHSQFYGEHIFGFTAAINLNETSVIGDVKAPANLTSDSQRNTLFNREEEARLIMGQPQDKIALSLNYHYKKLSVDLRTIRFGKVGAREATVDENGFNILDQDYSAKWVTNLEIHYSLTNSIGIYIGANNIFDVYPDENKPEKQDFGRFPYNTAVTQFGFMGAYYYTGLNIRL